MEWSSADAGSCCALGQTLHSESDWSLEWSPQGRGHAFKPVRVQACGGCMV